MSQPKMEVKLIEISKITTNPFQPRQFFPKEEIQRLAETIKEVGLLQPITVRKEGERYQLISGERRWRASQYAGFKEIPAIVKNVTDGQMMIESLVENVQRSDLEPIEKAKGLSEAYKLRGFEPPDRVASKLKMIEGALAEGYRKGKLTQEEENIKEIADMIGLSYDYQYRLLSQLRLSQEEQRRATELKLGFAKISSISSIEEGEDRKRLIEIAPTLERGKVQTVTKIIKKAPKTIREAVLEKKVTPEIAEELLKIERPSDQSKALQIAKTGVYTKEGFQTRLSQIVRPRIELPQESIEDQIFSKSVWNLERIGDFNFYTVGYEKKTFEQFLRLLKIKRVKTLVDVRKNPISQYRPEFNKDNLKKSLAESHIAYVHYPELGVSSEIRRELGETSNYDWFFKMYDKNVRANVDRIDLTKLEKPFAIMCVEFDPTKCHRHRIALELERRGLKGIDL